MIDLPRSTYYYRSTAKALSLGDSELVAIIEDIQDELPCYGYRRITHELQRRGHLVNHKRVARIMRANGLGIKPRKRYVRTTDSNHDSPIYPNLYRNVIPARPDMVWVADFAYIRITVGFCYLAVILDACSRKVVGYALSRRLDTPLALAALHSARPSQTSPRDCPGSLKMFTMPSGCTQLLAISRQQNSKLNSPSRRLSFKRIAGPARGVHSIFPPRSEPCVDGPVFASGKSKFRCGRVQPCVRPRSAAHIWPRALMKSAAFEDSLAKLPNSYVEGSFSGRPWGVTVKRSEDGKRMLYCSKNQADCLKTLGYLIIPLRSSHDLWICDDHSRSIQCDWRVCHLTAPLR
ncbi:transposase (plasmid) [Agrobacterium tumefaciens]|nr:transposase [Agrobacterium tumefaciens]